MVAVLFLFFSPALFPGQEPTQAAGDPIEGAFTADCFMYAAYFESQKTGGNIKYLAEQRDLQTGKLLDESSRILSPGPGGLSLRIWDWWPFQYNPNSYIHVYAVLRIDQVVYDVLFSGTVNCS